MVQGGQTTSMISPNEPGNRKSSWKVLRLVSASTPDYC